MADAEDPRFAELLGTYGRFLRRTIASLCPRSLGLDIDEIEQDARIRLWRAIADERPITSPASYLHRIAATATIDAIRRVRARREDPLEPSSDSPDEAAVGMLDGRADTNASPERVAAGRELGAHVQQALGTLDENRRRAVGLHLRGFTSQEIGTLLGWTEPKARNLASRGMKDLREKLTAMGIEAPR